MIACRLPPVHVIDGSLLLAVCTIVTDPGRHSRDLERGAGLGRGGRRSRGRRERRGLGRRLRRETSVVAGNGEAYKAILKTIHPHLTPDLQR